MPAPSTVTIKLEDPGEQRVVALLTEHLDDMAATSPACSMHALDREGLQRPEVSFWTAMAGSQLAGCCALVDLGEGHGEIKSMRTVESMRGHGIATVMLEHIMTVARERGWRRLSLETGSQEFFAPARRLYARHGFRECPPFADYAPDPNSVFMTLEFT